MVFVVLPAHAPVAELPATTNTPHPLIPSCVINWLWAELVVVGLIQASKVSFDAGAKAEAYATVGCAVSLPAKYSEPDELDAASCGDGDEGA
jgi:hypothetical protein